MRSILERLHYQVYGPAENGGQSVAMSSELPKLVFLHGVMGYAANWRRIARAFESRCQVLVYDQRGHGRSFHPESGYEADDYASDLLELLDALEWSKVNLVGHSMGGRVALKFSSIHPDRVTRLVIEDIGPSMLQAGSSLVLRMLDAVPVPFSDKRTAKHWFDTEFLELFKAERKKEDLAAYLYANLVENDAKQAVWRFSEQGVRESVRGGRTHELWQEVRLLAMPTLLIRGELSKDLPRDVYERVLRENPRISGVEIAGAGHWVHSEKPEEFIAQLEAFLFSADTIEL